MGKIIKDRYPELDDEDQESVRQHAIAALNLTQKAKETLNNNDELVGRGNTALIDGVRKFTMDVTDLDVDWIDSINPFSEAYSILSKSMTEQSLKAMAEVISARKPNISADEARELAKRGLKFKQERGRLPDIKSADPWEQRMAQGIAFLARMKAEAAKGYESSFINKDGGRNPRTAL